MGWELSYINTSEHVNRDSNCAYIWKPYSGYSNFWMLVTELQDISNAEKHVNKSESYPQHHLPEINTVNILMHFCTLYWTTGKLKRCYFVWTILYSTFL